MRELYIIWNDNKDEGFITDSIKNATKVLAYSRGSLTRGEISAVGKDFADMYEDQELSLEKVKI